MIRRYAIGLLALVAIGFVAAPAEAGGGGTGTKRSVSIKTSNLTAGEVCVFSLTEKQAAAGTFPTSVKDAQKNFGGVVITAGKSKTVKVPAGKGVLAAFDPAGLLAANGAGYNLNNGASTTARVGDDGAGNLVVTIP